VNCTLISLKGVKATHWGLRNKDVLILSREAAFFIIIAAEYMKQCIPLFEDARQRSASLWLAGTNFYS